MPDSQNVSTSVIEGSDINHLEDTLEPMNLRSSLSSGTHAEVDLDLSCQRNFLHQDHRPERTPVPSDSNDLEKASTMTEILYVEFEKGDKRNPINFSGRKKWAMTFMACTFTLVTAMEAGSYNLGFPSMIQDLKCTEFQATIGLSVYALGFGTVALFTVSFSEEFGRQNMYLFSLVGYLVMHVAIAMSKTIQTVIVARFIQAAFGSTGATMVGGTIADLWLPHQRGLPMSIFGAAAFGGIAIGPIIGGWIEMNPHLQWRWIQWIEMIICGVYIVVFPTVMRETRSSILLIQMAKKLRKETGDHRYRARIEDERESLRTLVYISCTRPIYLLLTEPTVMSFSIWAGFAWGVTYCVIESIGGVFRDLHHFNDGEIGSTFVCMIIGTALGLLSNKYQEKLYQKHFAKKGPEARLHSACFAAILLPVGMLIYAWSSFPWVHWIALMIGITIFMWAIFIIFLAVFTYLADCYGPYASSALAGQSLFRNLMATVFPLFTQQMFAALSYKWASTLIALIAVVLIPIPYILFFYGSAIRARSTFSRKVIDS